MSDESFKVLDGKVEIHSYKNESKAKKVCIELVKKNPSSNYRVVAEREIFNSKTAQHVMSADLMGSALEKLLPLVEKNFLSPNLPSFLDSISSKAKKGDVSAVLASIKAYKPTKKIAGAKESAKVNKLKNKSKSFVSNYIECLSEEETFCLSEEETFDNVLFLSDAIEFCKIAQALAQGKLSKFKDLIWDLDTGARDELPESVWNYYDKLSSRDS